MRRIDKRKSACYFIARIKKPLKRRSNRKGRPQRAGELLRTRGRCAGKWIAEGKGKRGGSAGVSGPCARVKGRKRVGAFVREDRLAGSSKVVPWVCDDRLVLRGAGLFCTAGRSLSPTPVWHPAANESPAQSLQGRQKGKEGFPWQKRETSRTPRAKAFPFRT